MSKLNNEIICACPYCDQLIDAEGNEFDTVEDAEDFAVKKCACGKAQGNANFIKNLESATREIEALFPGDDEVTFKRRTILTYLAEAVLSGNLDAISVKVGYSTTVKISPGNKCTIVISRTDTLKQEKSI